MWWKGWQRTDEILLLLLTNREHRSDPHLQPSSPRGASLLIGNCVHDKWWGNWRGEWRRWLIDSIRIEIHILWKQRKKHWLFNQNHISGEASQPEHSGRVPVTEWLTEWAVAEQDSGFNHCGGPLDRLCFSTYTASRFASHWTIHSRRVIKLNMSVKWLNAGYFIAGGNPTNNNHTSTGRGWLHFFRSVDICMLTIRVQFLVALVFVPHPPTPTLLHLFWININIH